MAIQWEVYKDRADEYRVRLTYNSEIIWTSEGYASLEAAQGLIDSPGTTFKWEIYKDRAGEYIVRFKYNSEIIWTSEGYESLDAARELIDSVKGNAQYAPVEGPDSEIADLKRRLELAPIPASDRIVRIDDNSEGKKEFSDALKKLTESIRESNDFGDLTDDEISVMRSEVSTIDPISQHKWVRPAHLWQIAKSTLLWLADRAAGTVVERLALALLEALAKMLGIPL